jgi:outer membrane protein assembly factor BamB
MMKITLSLILGLSLLSISVISQPSSQWRGKDRNGTYPDTDLKKFWPGAGPELLWHFDELGSGHASAVVATDGTIFTSGMQDSTGHIYAFSPDGKLLWDTPYGTEWTVNFPGTRSTPLIDEGKVYMVSSFGRIVCLSAEKGNILWTADVLKDYDGRNIVWGITENLLADGDKLFCTVGGVKDNVIALDKNTGKLIWTSAGNEEESAYGSPLLITLPERKILVTMTAKSILGLDAATGSKLWSHEQVNQWSVHANTPLYSNGYLYCVSGYGCGGVMLKLSPDGTSVEEVWRNKDLDSRMGGVVLLDGKIYGLGDKTKGLYAIDWASGKQLGYDKMNNKFGSIITADGLLYTYDESGEVMLIEPTLTGFKKTGGFKVPFGSAQHWAHPVIAGGRLYIRHGGSLMVYSLR